MTSVRYYRSNNANNEKEKHITNDEPYQIIRRFFYTRSFAQVRFNNDENEEKKSHSLGFMMTTMKF